MILLVPALALAQVIVAPPIADSAFRVADTVRLEPIGVRMVVPPLWMGLGGHGGLGCQTRPAGSVNDRILVGPARPAPIVTDPFGAQQALRPGIESLGGAPRYLASLNGEPPASNCVAPHIDVYTADAREATEITFDSLVIRVVKGSYRDAHSIGIDSAGWHVFRVGWIKDESDWSHPEGVDLWMHRVRGRLLLIVVFDRWSDPVDVDHVLAAVDWARP